jgi:preprotein translocase subunit SecG
MSTLIIIVHILVCVALILIVLLQTGKGASMGAAFGGSSQTIFGSSGASTFLTKLTTAVAVIFMFTSLLLAFLHGPSSRPSMVETPAGGAVPQQTVPKQAPVPAPTGTPAAKPPVTPAAPVNK